MVMGVHQIVQDAFGVLVDHVSGFGQRGKSGGACGFHPVPQKFHGPGERGILPEPVEVFLQGPRGAGLKVLPQQAAELRSGLAAKILRPFQPQIFASF